MIRKKKKISMAYIIFLLTFSLIYINIHLFFMKINWENGRQGKLTLDYIYFMKTILGTNRI